MHSMDAGVVGAVASALAQLAASPQGRQMMLNCGTLGDLVLALDSQRQVEQTCVSILQAIQAMCCPDDDTPLALRLITNSNAGYKEAKAMLVDTSAVSNIAAIISDWDELPAATLTALRFVHHLTGPGSERNGQSILQRLNSHAVPKLLGELQDGSRSVNPPASNCMS